MKKVFTLFLFFVSIFLISCEPTTESDLSKAYIDLELPDELTATQLPSTLYGIPITWTSSIDDVLDNDNTIVPLALDVNVQLTASLSFEDKVMVKTFNVTILKDEDLAEDLIVLQNTGLYLDELIHDVTTIDAITLDTDLALPTSYNDVTIVWESSDENTISITGIVTYPDEGSSSVTVELTAIMTYNGITFQESYLFIVYPEDTTVIFEGYYVGVSGLSGEALKTFLHDLIDDHRVQSYSSLWDHLDDTDMDPNNTANVILLYSGMSISELNHGGNTNQWNREHVWPRSHGDLEDAGGPAYTDLHHIRPTLVQVNSARGNLDFDMGGTLVGNTDDCYKDGDSFEPRDDVKGDVARMLFYMAVRYEGDSGELDLELNDNVNNSGPYIGRISILLQWHVEDPVDDFEIARNNAIFEIQGNRNPFIDHPEFVQMIWSN
jgi:endonuclease I